MAAAGRCRDLGDADRERRPDRRGGVLARVFAAGDGAVAAGATREPQPVAQRDDQPPQRRPPDCRRDPAMGYRRGGRLDRPRGQVGEGWCRGTALPARAASGGRDRHDHAGRPARSTPGDAGGQRPAGGAGRGAGGPDRGVQPPASPPSVMGPDDAAAAVRARHHTLRQADHRAAPWLGAGDGGNRAGARQPGPRSCRQRRDDGNACRTVQRLALVARRDDRGGALAAAAAPAGCARQGASSQARRAARPRHPGTSARSPALAACGERRRDRVAPAAAGRALPARSGAAHPDDHRIGDVAAAAGATPAGPWGAGSGPGVARAAPVRAARRAALAGSLPGALAAAGGGTGRERAVAQPDSPPSAPATCRWHC